MKVFWVYSLWNYLQFNISFGAIRNILEVGGGSIQFLTRACFPWKGDCGVSCFGIFTANRHHHVKQQRHVSHSPIVWSVLTIENIPRVKLAKQCAALISPQSPSSPPPHDSSCARLRCAQARANVLRLGERREPFLKKKNEPRRRVKYRWSLYSW